MGHRPYEDQFPGLRLLPRTKSIQEAQIRKQALLLEMRTGFSSRNLKGLLGCV